MKRVLLTILTFSAFIFTTVSANPGKWTDKDTHTVDESERSDFQIAGGKDKPKKNKDKAKKEKVELDDDVDEMKKDKVKKAKQEKDELDDDVDEMKKDKSKKAKKEKDELDDDVDIDEDSAKLKGIEKQTAKKAEQEQKELDKGSEQGQTSREQHRKKWWQFWGDDSEE